jgi:hypothetical protein
VFSLQTAGIQWLSVLLRFAEGTDFDKNTVFSVKSTLTAFAAGV